MEILRRLRKEFVLSIGMAKEVMVRADGYVNLDEYQLSLLPQLKAAFEEADYPRPEFDLDDPVETRPGVGTHRVGVIRDRIWHGKNGVWNYYLECKGKRVSKRYLAEDLTRADCGRS